MICNKCGFDIGNAKKCRYCLTKETKKKFPIEFKNEDKILCSYGCGQIAKYKYKNGNVSCSKSHVKCPNLRKRIKKKCTGKKHSEETRNKISNSAKGKIPWNTGLTKEMDERVKKISSSNKGKIISKETRKKLSESCKGKITSEETKRKIGEANKGNIAWSKGLTKETDKRLKKTSESHKGKKLSEETKEKLRKANKGKIVSEETKKRQSESHKGKCLTDEHKKKIGEAQKNLHEYKKLVINNIRYPSYDFMKTKISFCEEIRRDFENRNVLNVKCAYCGKWYRPNLYSAYSRANSLNTINSDIRFYCSEECKTLCPIYGQVKFPKGFKNNNSIEVDPHLRQMVFERDNWTCQKCYSTTSLECHHIDPKSLNPGFANDMDSCITLCKDCHKEVHMKDGCRYYDLRRPECNEVK